MGEDYFSAESSIFFFCVCVVVVIATVCWIRCQWLRQRFVFGSEQYTVVSGEKKQGTLNSFR